MKSQLLVSLLIIFSFCSISVSTNAQTTITVGSSGATYTTLKLVFDAINAGAVTGAITIQVVANTTETASAVLNASGTGSASYSAINIYPTVTGLIISGNLAVPLIDLNGADNVTIDGRLNATGSTKDMFITNTSTSNVAGTSTLRFINDATTNTVKFCTIRGSESLASYGVIYFGVSAGANGNDNNTISDNNITNAGTRPINAVYSLGTSGKENSGVIFSNNNIYDFFPAGSTTGTAMNILGGNTEWSITGNSFYNVTGWNPGNTGFSIIIINNVAGNNFTVSGNYLGGSAPLCAGTPFTKGGSGRDGFICLNLNAGTTVTSNIQGNTIRNFSYNNTNNTRDFAAIQVGAGNVNIGTITGNVIGAATGTGSITGFHVQSFWGILVSSSGIINIENNIVGSITMGTTSTQGNSIQGISAGGNGIMNIRNNQVGSLSTANSIYASSAATAAGQSVYGIICSSSGVVTISGNTIAKIANNSTIAGCFITGLYNGAAATGSSVSGNFIGSLTLTNPSPAANALYGINIAGGSSTYSNNIINLGNNAPASIYGMEDAGGTNNIYFNSVYIGGTPASAASPSYAIRSTGSNTRNYRNNLFVNARSNSGASGNNYAVGLTSAPANIDYNDYYVSGTNGILGVFNSVDKTTLADWKLSSIQDCNSYSTSPSFAVAGGTLAANYLPAEVSLMATTGTGITTDFTSAARNSSIPAMGAFEYGITPGSNSLHVSSFLPVTGAVGSSVAITGTNFTGVSALNFNGTAVTSYTINSATSITATVPTGTTTGPISLTLSCGPFTDINNFTIQSLLPVSWLSFNARQVSEHVLLEWRTVVEEDSKDFLVEYSSDGLHWFSLGTVAAAGRSNSVATYGYTHLSPVAGKNYYRIRQRDIDGQSSYSKVINILFIGSSASMQIYGNPVTNGQLVLQLYKASVLSVLNQNGQILFSRSLGMGLQTISLDGYSKGVYLIRAGNEIQKFIID